MGDWIHALGWFDFLGIVGVIVYVGSYFCLQAGIIKGQGYFYASLNASAAICVLLSLIQSFNLSSALSQIAFILISVFGMVRFYILNHRITFSEEERTFIKAIVPSLVAFDARQLLDLGFWNTMRSGTSLTEEGKAPENFYFLLDGGAKVEVSGSQVAELGPSSIIGEMSWLTGMEASASVCLTDQSRLFSIKISNLNGFLKRNPDVRQELQAQFAKQISEKLILTNAALSERE